MAADLADFVDRDYVGMPELGDGLLVAVLAVVEYAKIVVPVPVVRTKRDGLLVSRLGVGWATGTFIRMGDANERIRITGVEL